MNCDTSMQQDCACNCHKTGVKLMHAVHPPTPCCKCEALSYAPIFRKSDMEIVAEKLEKLEKWMNECNKTDNSHQSHHNELDNRIENLEQYVKRQSELPSIDCGEINKVIDRINKFDETHNKKPYKCPVCDSEGFIKCDLEGLKKGLYSPAAMSQSNGWLKCHTCEGKGIVWG